MTRRLHVRDEAELDVIDAVAWYEDQRIGPRDIREGRQLAWIALQEPIKQPGRLSACLRGIEPAGDKEHVLPPEPGLKIRLHGWPSGSSCLHGILPLTEGV